MLFATRSNTLDKNCKCKFQTMPSVLQWINPITHIIAHLKLEIAFNWFSYLITENIVHDNFMC